MVFCVTRQVEGNMSICVVDSIRTHAMASPGQWYHCNLTVSTLSPGQLLYINTVLHRWFSKNIIVLLQFENINVCVFVCVLSSSPLSPLAYGYEAYEDLCKHYHTTSIIQGQVGIREEPHWQGASWISSKVKAARLTCCYVTTWCHGIIWCLLAGILTRIWEGISTLRHLHCMLVFSAHPWSIWTKTHW